MAKHKVAVVMGGVSSEHEVSLRSGAMVAGNLDREKYEAIPVIITPEGKWKILNDRPCHMTEALSRICEFDVQCIFIALHGPNGEDGRIQGVFDMLGIPYVGSGCGASALAIDKVRAKAVAAHAGISVARDRVVTRAQWDADHEAVLKGVHADLGFPCVLKSPCQGSSLGMAIPRGVGEFREALLNVLAFDDTVLIEEYLDGVEVTCSVLDATPGAPPQALPVTEICPVTATYFDYNAKYVAGATEEITPARIAPEITKQVQDIAVRVHAAIGCRGLSRSDMILVDERPVWFEVNTIPGMTETSLFPQAAAAAGISFPDLLDRLVQGSMKQPG
ncbi:MAG: D-alanine--D-alanine ligase [Candidatus Hydrogenedentota bacterium]